MRALVVAVSARSEHSIHKDAQPELRLLEGLGVLGDAHYGKTVQHRSRIAKNPDAPNLRQVHLIHTELHEELAALGFTIGPGAMGENLTTRGIDLLGLPEGARLHIGQTAVVEITGLRNPCQQLEGLSPGLMAATLDRGPDGEIVRKAGVMGIVVVAGKVRPGDAIEARLPEPPHRPLAPV